MPIRAAHRDDIDAIVAFTTDTFSWGDYVPDKLEGWIDNDLTHLPAYTEAAADAIGITRAPNYPVVGPDAFVFDLVSRLPSAIPQRMMIAGARRAARLCRFWERASAPFCACHCCRRSPARCRSPRRTTRESPRSPCLPHGPRSPICMSARRPPQVPTRMICSTS